MLRPGGVAIVTSPEPSKVRWDRFQCEEVREGITERDSITCFHCGSVEFPPVRPGPNDIGFCRYCMQRICQSCTDLPCKPYEKQMEEEERGLRQAIERDRALRAYF